MKEKTFDLPSENDTTVRVGGTNPPKSACCGGESTWKQKNGLKSLVLLCENCRRVFSPSKECCGNLICTPLCPKFTSPEEKITKAVKLLSSAEKTYTLSEIKEIINSMKPLGVDGTLIHREELLRKLDKLA